MCSPWTFALTLQGTATPGGEPLYTNPATPGAYEFAAVLASEWDADNDGYSNATDNCAQNANADQLDADEDLAGDACDTSPAVRNNDIDGDSIGNGFDNCALVANSTQSDGDFDGLGGACDGAPGSATGTRYVLGCAQYLYVGVPGSGTGACSNLTQTPSAPTPTPVPGSAVGGVAESPDLAALPAPASSAGGARRGAYAGLAAGTALLAAASVLARTARRRR
ncbi:MAG: thrombospondin type 3 repeat-containing protein [Chloroflexi bacterium]|nr:thrombospondin type 3 repeat-containing protein [Chloroflexota bacterium]